MPVITVAQPSTAPAEKVWEIMTGVDRWTETIGAIVDVKRLDGGEGFATGLRWVETRTMMGKEATEEMWVSDVDHDAHTYVVEAESHGMQYRSVLSVTRSDEGSTLSMTFAGEAQTTVAKLLALTLGKLFEGATRKALQQDLVDITAAAEQA
ncbi:MAG: hypothetical protein ACI9AD_001542 [Nitriliruptoraceae bacterium]|jgi:hypothetical protein